MLKQVIKHIEQFYTEKKSQIFLTLFLSLCAIALSACNEVTVDDGIVPAEYAPYVQAYLGTYQGQVDGKPTEITITMTNNIPAVTVRNAYGNDITGMNCRSQVGRLKSIKAEERGNKNYVLERVNFDLDRGFCMIQGRAVTFNFKSANEFSLEILNQDERKNCPPPRTGPPGTGPIDEPCDEFSTVNYITGQFKK